MSHPPQPTYGRPAYTYGAPPPASQAPPYGAGGYAQQAPPDTRYYSPGPGAQNQQYSSQEPQPFYFVPPGQQQAQGGPPGGAQAMAPKPQASSDDLYTGPPPRTNPAALDPGRRQTMYDVRPAGGPQELATAAYDSPLDQRHSFVAPQGQQKPFSSVASLPSQQQQQYAQQQPSQSAHAPPGPPDASSSPVLQQGGYPGQPGPYAAYPGQQRWAGQAAAAGGGGTREEGGAEGFYR